MTDFAQVEKEFERLKAQFEGGALTEVEFKSQLEELMIEDEQGQWWIIGYESGLWYYHDGDQWVQSDPPPVVQRRERAEVEAEVEVEAAPAPVPVEEPEPEVEAAPAPVPVDEPEPEVEAAPEPVPVEEPEIAPVAEERPEIRPAEREEFEPPPTEPRSRTAWIVAAVIVVIVVVIVLTQVFPSEPKFGIWAERDAIQRGECTLLLWAAPDQEGVFVVGPDTDDTMLMPPEGNLEVCPEGTSWYELKSPEWEELSRVQVHVGE